ncbi:MAG TPA: M23 family metallopeptidase [Gemmatimonadaceae bacterium]|nr:M23 family metallopeptidase [Gemmatimonadaceae bacterium]
MTRLASASPVERKALPPPLMPLMPQSPQSPLMALLPRPSRPSLMPQSPLPPLPPLLALLALPALLALSACAPGLTPLPGPFDPAPDPMELPLPANPAAAGAASAELAALLRAKRLMVPVAGIAPEKVPDTFTARRGDRIHSALDIMAARGTPVLSADAGRVFKVRSNALGGLTVYALDATERFVYYYAHLERYADGLAEGQPLQPGDVIGYVGTTGNAPRNAPHLHFQVLLYRGNGRWWDGDPLNPRPFLARAGRIRTSS